MTERMAWMPDSPTEFAAAGGGLSALGALLYAAIQRFFRVKKDARGDKEGEVVAAGYRKLIADTNEQNAAAIKSLNEKVLSFEGRMTQMGEQLDAERALRRKAEDATAEVKRVSADEIQRLNGELASARNEMADMRRRLDDGARERLRLTEELNTLRTRVAANGAP